MLALLAAGSGCPNKNAALRPSTPPPTAPSGPEETSTPGPAMAVDPEPAQPDPPVQPDPPKRALEIRMLAAPPFAATLQAEARLEQGPAPKLKKVSQSRNQIIDDEKWFAEHGLRLPTHEVPNRNRGTAGNLPGGVPPEFQGFPIVKAIDDGEHTLALYGPDFGGGTKLLVIDAQGNGVAALDFERWTRGPADVASERQFTEQRLTWAAVREGVLFVSHGHRTYASSSGGKNAYLSAIDLKTGELLWQSEPLVANARNFLVEDGWIITGYGFTNEPDHLFVLDARTGEIAQRIKLRKGPSYILRKGDQVLVRTYDTDYVFALGR